MLISDNFNSGFKKGFGCYVEDDTVDFNKLESGCELSTYEEGSQYGDDVAYPIDDILDYEYDKKEDKEKYLCKFASIGDKSWPDPECVNGSCVSAPALKKKVEGKRNEVLKKARVYTVKTSI